MPALIRRAKNASELLIPECRASLPVLVVENLQVGPGHHCTSFVRFQLDRLEGEGEGEGGVESIRMQIFT